MKIIQKNIQTKKEIELSSPYGMPTSTLEECRKALQQIALRDCGETTTIGSERDWAKTNRHEMELALLELVDDESISDEAVFDFGSSEIIYDPIKDDRLDHDVYIYEIKEV